MAQVVNGTLYISNPPAKEGFYETAATEDGDFLIADNAVVTGPVTFTGTVTVTGTLVVV